MQNKQMFIYNQVEDKMEDAISNSKKNKFKKLKYIK